ncbi:MAG TPA: hypothetical protein V6C52_08570 [Coleofasciculaceae cyanobacterium]|jgi:hypothetical protein
MTQLIIPDFQPVPFPAPLPLLNLLLVLGFFLHALPMNVSLGGSLVAGIYLLTGKKGSYTNRIGHALAISLPIFISFAITQGIVPLLFLQLVYGPLYYTSSILMGTPWILLLIVLMLGYYGCYIYKFRHVQLGPLAAWILIGVSLLFGCIGFLFSNNMTLMLHPETWRNVVHHGGVGNFFNTGDVSLLPRFLHFALASLAVTGLAIGCFGLYWRSREAEYGNWLIKQGAGLFSLITVIQVGVGGWFLFSLPKGILHNYMGHETWGTVAFGSSMLLSLVALISMLAAWKNGQSGPFKVGLVSSVLVVLLMSWMRHLLREYSVNPFFKPESVPVNTQWDLLTVFIISAVGLLVYLGWLVKVSWKAFHDQPEPEQSLPQTSLT